MSLSEPKTASARVRLKRTPLKELFLNQSLGTFMLMMFNDQAELPKLKQTKESETFSQVSTAFNQNHLCKGQRQ